MKISAFAKRYGVSKDTLRYYVKMGLLMPKTTGSQLDFEEKDGKELTRILKMKDMRLSLTEIQNILYLHRMSNFIEPSTLHYCIELLENKEKDLNREKRELEQSMELIHQTVNDLKSRSILIQKTQSGVPLEGLPLLRCPVCGGIFRIKDAVIEENAVQQGKLECSCGYEASIRNGIVITPERYTGSFDTPDMERKLYHETGPEYNACALKCPKFMLEKINQEEMKGKVCLEANINGFFFVYNFLSKLPHDCLYVIVDKYPEVLLQYKTLIDTLYQDLSILYIADAGEKLPLAPHSVDTYLSLFGENEYSFYHTHCQLQDISSILKPEAKIIGAYQSMAWRSKTRENLQQQYPEGNPAMCNLAAFQKSYRAAGFTMDAILLGTVTRTLKHHMYKAHVDGEPIEMYGFVAKRKTEE